MEYAKVDVAGDDLFIRAYYTESKISVTHEGKLPRAQFFWGDGESYDNELEALKAAYAYVDGIHSAVSAFPQNPFSEDE